MRVFGQGFFKRLQFISDTGLTRAKRLVLAAVGATALTVPLVAGHGACAQDLSGNSKYASIVVDAQSGEVLYAARADSARYPASLTKIMTLYMVFDALARGDLKPTDTITVSEHAAGQAPVKVYLRAGDTIDVDTAMRLAAMYSANDMAVALAEKVGGSEERMAALMTIRAQTLGMTQTRFVNANGLPDARQLSSARDLAILARAVMRDYPQYYSYFDLNSVTYRGRTYYNHNPLHGLPGVDGMKTGYTNAAGQNLVVSQVKDGHRLIAVMLGAADKQQRREHVTELLNVGFNVESRRDHGEQIAMAQTEFDKAMNVRFRAPDSAPDSVLLASNTKPLSDSELRDTLAGSEQANATDTDVERASAKVDAPDLAQALTQRVVAQASAQPALVGAASAPQPYSVIRASTPAVAVAPVVDKSAQQRAAAIELAAKQASVKKTVVATNDDDDAPVKGKKKKKNPDAIWSIQVGAFKEKSLAANWVKNIQHRFDDALAESTSQVTKTDEGWYRTRFATLTKEQAHDACRSITAKHLDCMVIKPDA